ncbi:MAG: hypothetical protein Salg2KO_03050 [Salibacteraceae bacterium]
MSQMRNIWIGISLMTLYSCQTVVEIDLPERESELTVNSIINTENNIRVEVSASKGVLEPGEIEQVDKAQVTVRGSDGTEATVRFRTSDPLRMSDYYEVPIIPLPNIQYSIRVESDGFETATSSTVVPNSTSIVRVDTAIGLVDGELTSQVSLTFRDRADELNYYELKFYALLYVPDTINGQVYYTPITQEIYAIPASLDDFFGQGDDELIFDDELFDGLEYTQRVNYYYEVPFVGQDTLQFTEGDVRNFLSTYLVSELRTLSFDYYQFQSTYNVYRFSSGDPFAQPVQVYTNIDNGFGIFGGFSSSFDTLRISKGVLPSPID